MNQKWAIWIELLIGAAATGALSATANAAAAPELFQHANYAHVLVRIAVIGAIISLRDQIKKSPMPDVAAPAPEANNSTATATAAQEALHGSSDGHSASN